MLVNRSCVLLHLPCPVLLESMLHVLEILPKCLLVRVPFGPPLGRNLWVSPWQVPPTLLGPVLPFILRDPQKLPLN